ncbi:MAG: DUF4276 family protein [Pirellulales bacterium]|nr:DUF4276 family protein [Pirellulales bacterium]
MAKSRKKFPACAVVAEDRSDVEAIQVLVKRIADQPSLQVKGKGCDGCGDLLKKGAAILKRFAERGAKRFIICADADGTDPKPVRKQVEDRVVRPSGLEKTCIVIPVQEFEAWVLADISAVTKIFSSWKPKEIGNPEAVESPKEHLERLSRDGKARPRYSHAMHNAKVAEHLDLDVVYKKCKSFRTLHKFVCNG